MLKELGSDLARRGVHFVDLTNVFANTSEALYRDNCCHVNINGLRLVSAAIAKAIASDLPQKHSGHRFATRTSPAR